MRETYRGRSERAALLGRLPAAVHSSPGAIGKQSSCDRDLCQALSRGSSEEKIVARRRLGSLVGLQPPFRTFFAVFRRWRVPSRSLSIDVSVLPKLLNVLSNVLILADMAYNFLN